MTGRRRDVAERFWEKVEKSDGCWLWRGAINRRGGYGKFKPRSYTMVTAHRFSYELSVGPITDGLYVCHRCDTPACVRPDHLFLGTAGDNIRDMHAKGRHPGLLNFKGIKPGPRRVRTHCKYGHEFTETNTYQRGRKRFCRACHKQYERIRRAELSMARAD